jgi:hypothetical protein
MLFDCCSLSFIIRSVSIVAVSSFDIFFDPAHSFLLHFAFWDRIALVLRLRNWETVITSFLILGPVRFVRLLLKLTGKAEKDVVITRLGSCALQYHPGFCKCLFQAFSSSSGVLEYHVQLTAGDVVWRAS